MNRRMIVIGAGLAALLVLFVVYWLHVRGPGAGPLGLTPRAPRPTGGEGVSARGVQAGPGTELSILQYDSRHRLQAKYLADRWSRVGQRIHLVRPQVEWYLRGGEVVRIQARQGRVTAQDIGEKVNVREGELMGDVRITFDRNPDPNRGPVEDRPDDTVRIHVDALRFDNDTLEITSDSHVSLFAKEADILGRGLRIAWSEGPRQLRELRIHQGEYMCIREGQERFVSEALLPGGVDETPTQPTTAPAQSGAIAPGGLPMVMAAAALAATATADAPAASMPASMPATAPAAMATTAAASMPASAPADTPTPAASAPAPVVKEAFVAVFTGDVVVASGARHIRGADELKLVFQFNRPGQRTEPRSRPAGVVVHTQPAEGTAATAPAEAEPAPPGQPMFLTWRGPLVLEPFRSHEGYKRALDETTPKGNRFDVYAKGSRIELADGGSKAVCQAFEVHSPEQRGKLMGSAAEPVVLTLPTGERVSSRLVRFDLAARVVNLDGAGSMRLPSGTEMTVARKPAAAPPQRQALSITWRKAVELTFDRQEVAVAGGTKRREYLRTAWFAGDVNARQADTQKLRAGELLVKFKQPRAADDKLNVAESVHASGGVRLADVAGGDYINADRLDVEMTQTPDGRTVPAQAVASGSVSARQDDTEIIAHTLGVTFAYERDPETGKRRIRPKILTASGKVKVTDTRDPDEPIVAEGDTLRSDLAARTATLTDGKVAQKDNRIEGEKIHLDQYAETARVEGRGKLRFYTNTDLSGSRSDTPRPVDIAWTKGMAYDGKTRIAGVSGDVSLVTGGDTMQCQKLSVNFEPAKEAKEPATRPVSRVKAEAERFRAQRIHHVIAEDNVRLESVRKDAEGFLLRRIMLKTPKQLTYEPQLQQLNCAGPGTLSVEDYRPPAAKPAAGRDDVLALGSMARPSQSAFEWAKSMKMDQKERLVHLTGGVKLAHFSGRQMLLSKQLTIRPYTVALPAGRKTVMACDTMLAKFAAPDDKDRKKGDPLGGPRVGELELFDAGGVENDVNMVDGPRQVLCRRVLYERQRDIAVIWGSLPGEPVKDAVLYHEDKKRGTLNSWKSPKLIWYRKTNRVESRDVRVDGGR